MAWHNQICIAQCLYSYRDILPKIWAKPLPQNAKFPSAWLVPLKNVFAHTTTTVHFTTLEMCLGPKLIYLTHWENLCYKEERRFWNSPFVSFKQNKTQVRGENEYISWQIFYRSFRLISKKIISVVQVLWMNVALFPGHACRISSF